MFDSLGSLRHLEVLVLLGSLGGASIVDSTSDDLPELHLPSLKSLYLEDGAHICAVLSYTLHVPDTCHIVMQAVFVRQRSDAYARNLVRLLSLPSPPVVYITLTPTGLWMRATTPHANVSRTAGLSKMHWRENASLLAEIGAQLSARAATVCLGIRIPVTHDEIGDLATLCGGAAAVATGFRFGGAPADLAIAAACMADRAGFLPRLQVVSFVNFDMGAATEMDVDMWVRALMERKKAGAALRVEWGGCTGASMELQKRVDDNKSMIA